MNQPLTSVRCTVDAQVGAPPNIAAPVPAELHYDLADPCAVRLSLGAPLTSPVDWVFARDLLAEGLHLPTGIGDVQVSPLRLDRTHRVRITLRSATGAAVVDIDAAETDAFLRQSFALVPPGTESAHIDLDRAVADVMGRSA
ncbi:SsgA family sporulation/cell division regulator [Streptomyces sp. NPDC002855]|uniref:SsgA family sporulation/cell division regulator n=1 Tax=unclassified Streptomyces TaxID=2593676 RepID=UPI00332D0155